jgi:hypothetical protein
MVKDFSKLCNALKSIETRQAHVPFTDETSHVFLVTRLLISFVCGWQPAHWVAQVVKAVNGKRSWNRLTEAQES